MRSSAISMRSLVHWPRSHHSRPEDALDVKSISTSFHIIYSNIRFTKAVSELVMVRSTPVAFPFPEEMFSFDVAKDEFCGRGLVYLVCRVD